jgi:hypothetical protein
VMCAVEYCSLTNWNKLNNLNILLNRAVA